MMDTQLSPLEWALEHLQLIGWPTVVIIAWKLRGAFDTLVNNYLKHIEKSQEEIAEGVKNLAEAAERHKDAIVAAIIASRK